MTNSFDNDIDGAEPEVSVVMPCLNEEETVAVCVEKALATMEKIGIQGEVVVADNGSTDRSVELAEKAGARVVHQPVRGYGAAYLAGLDAARGRKIVMGDSDDTYDFTDLERFLKPLDEGIDFVIGSRFKGEIRPGAMPWLHRYIGNPILSGILRILFRTSVSDSHCGMRAFTRKAYKRMALQTTGMEFASEMVVKAVRTDLKIKEIPIVYHPRKGESKLNSFRDGWRHIRFMLLFSPNHLFIAPGLVLMLISLAALAVMLPGPVQIAGRAYDVHVMTLAGFSALLGYQTASMGLYARAYALSAGFVERDRLLSWLGRVLPLERGIILGIALFLVGFAVDFRIAWIWVKSGFGPLNEMRAALFALICMALGVQTIFSAFVLSLLAIKKRGGS